MGFGFGRTQTRIRVLQLCSVEDQRTTYTVRVQASQLREKASIPIGLLWSWRSQGRSKTSFIVLYVVPKEYLIAAIGGKSGNWRWEAESGSNCHSLAYRCTEPAGSTMPLLSLGLSDTAEILHTFRQLGSTTTFGYEIFFTRERARGAAPPCKNLWHRLYLRNYQS